MVEDSVVVANALPAGWSDGFIGGLGAVPASGVVMRLSASISAAPLAMPAARLHRSAPADLLTDCCETATDFAPEQSAVHLAGAPQFVAGEAIVFDSASQTSKPALPDRATISRLEVRF